MFIFTHYILAIKILKVKTTSVDHKVKLSDFIASNKMLFKMVKIITR